MPLIRLASDGLPARVSGAWTQDKLVYVERYATAFMRAMAPKKKQGKWERLVYIDLLAGPGLGINRDTGVEFEGSPLRALRVNPPFDHFYFGDLKRQNVSALERRIPQHDRGRVTLQAGDCNELAKAVARKLSGRELGLAFVDPQGFEATFEMFRALSTRRIDVLYLFPGGIGVTRNLSAFARGVGRQLDAPWGGTGWRDLKKVGIAAGKNLSNEELRSRDEPFLLSFRQRLATLGFRYSDQGEPYFTNEKNAKMYRLLYFSKDPAGLTLWRNIRHIEPSGQRTLSF
jgi:three-Cys-motif partner protein